MNHVQLVSLRLPSLMRHSPHKINEFIFIAMSLVQLVNFQFPSLMRHSPSFAMNLVQLVNLRFPSLLIAMIHVQLVNLRFPSLMRHSPHKIKRKEFILKVNFPMNSFLSIFTWFIAYAQKSTNPNNLMFKLVPLVRLQGLEPWTP